MASDLIWRLSTFDQLDSQAHRTSGVPDLRRTLTDQIALMQPGRQATIVATAARDALRPTIQQMVVPLEAVYRVQYNQESPLIGVAAAKQNYYNRLLSSYQTGLQFWRQRYPTIGSALSIGLAAAGGGAPVTQAMAGAPIGVRKRLFKKKRKSKK